jgi:hypothetical protein
LTATLPISSVVLLLQLDGEVVEVRQTPIIAKALAAKGVHIYRVTGRAVYDAGVKPGDTISIDQSKEAIAAIKDWTWCLLRSQEAKPRAAAVRAAGSTRNEQERRK